MDSTRVMNYKKMQKQKLKKLDEEMREFDENRLVEMAWQDRTTFDTIYLQYNLTENQVKNRMRKLLSAKAFKRWRKRVQGRSTKHKINTGSKLRRFQGPW